MNKDTTTLSAGVLRTVGVEEDEAARLASQGLPKGEVGHLLCRPELGDNVVLAYDADVPLVVRDGRVNALDGSDRLVNTSASAFCAVVERFARYAKEVVNATSEEDGQRMARIAVSEMEALDAPAFESETSYWPIVCEQMIEGNL